MVGNKGQRPGNHPYIEAKKQSSHRSGNRDKLVHASGITLSTRQDRRAVTD